MNCPKDDCPSYSEKVSLKDGQVKGYYICESCKTVWYIAPVGNIH